MVKHQMAATVVTVAAIAGAPFSMGESNKLEPDCESHFHKVERKKQHWILVERNINCAHTHTHTVQKYTDIHVHMWTCIHG